ncbi:MAG: NUDIX domain-containing protein [Candidatus Daviesbacteria bacterium]|nr:NUDIX domain-containing protein [Candidatus Daviesbacteria bacterium]
MHPLRKQILYQLIINSCLPFSKLKPQGIESNLFIYHLKLLISEGLVIKRVDGKYELTAEGIDLADRLSLENFKVRIQPKIITLIVCQNKSGEFLLYKRGKQPLLGYVGFPYGKIHLGEKITQAAERELKEKTGLFAKLNHRGNAYLTTYQNDQVLTQVFCHIFEGENPVGKLETKTEIGECFWGKIEDFKEVDFIPGFLDIYNLIKKPNKNLFFAEFAYNI